MPRRGDQDAGTLHCSFCRKSQDKVLKLIASPNDRPDRAYICDECIVVCNSILEDDWNPSAATFAHHPLTPQLLSSVERWIRQESLGADAAKELAEVRAIATAMLRVQPS
jgi:ATP-dependent Clp protease ATP-binding subunit ClpX